MKFVTKPCEIEAIQWTGNTTEILEFCGEHASYDVNDAAWQVGKGAPVENLTIHTLEGDVQAQRNDFIIKGTHGEFYPCKPDIFMTKYEPSSKEFKKIVSNFSSKDIKYFIINGDENKLNKFILETFKLRLSKMLLDKKIEDKGFKSYEKGLLIQLPKIHEYPIETFLLLDEQSYIFFNDNLYLSNKIVQNQSEHVCHLFHLYGDKENDKRTV